MKIVYLILNSRGEPIHALSSSMIPGNDPNIDRSWTIASSIDGEVFEVFLDDPDIVPLPDGTWPYSVFFPGGHEPAEIVALEKEEGIYPEEHEIWSQGHTFRVHAHDEKIALTKARVRLYAWQKDNMPCPMKENEQCQN